MKASLDTNVIIHFYKAGLQNILFDFFDEGVFIYEQIRNVELSNHGKEILDKIDTDINAGKIDIYTDELLKERAVYIKHRWIICAFLVCIFISKKAEAK